MKVKVLQLDIAWLEPLKNIEKIDILADHEVDLLVLPEMYLTGFCMKPEKAAVPEDHAHIKQLLGICKKYDTAIIGSLAISEEGKYYNRVLLISSDGIIGRYDKQYLFSPSGEDAVFDIKHPLEIIQYKGWSILPQVCYDLRFPEGIRKLDAPILLIYMANWPKPRIHHWDALLRARAIENLCFVIGCNRSGKDMNGWEYVGHSQLVHPDGKVDMINDTGVLNIDIDDLEVLQYREKYPFLDDK